MAGERTPGSTLGGRYVLERRLGEGAFGQVWLARDVRAFDRRVAVKLLLEQHLSNRDVVSRFYREGKATAALAHPNVVALLEFGEDQGVPYLVSEFVQGDSLRAVLTQYQAAQSPVPTDDALVIFRQACAAVSAAHAKGIVHRDLKPENVMVEGRGASAHVRVLDFGLARIVQGGESGVPAGGPALAATAPEKTEAGRVMGSLKYMSPEQVVGDVNAIDARTDVFALTCVLFELLTLRKAFESDTYHGVVMQIIAGPRPRATPHRAGLAPGIDDVLERGFAIKREDRFGTVAELLEAADEALAGPAPIPLLPRPSQRAPAPRDEWSMVGPSASEPSSSGGSAVEVPASPPAARSGRTGTVVAVLAAFLAAGAGAGFAARRLRPASARRGATTTAAALPRAEPADGGALAAPPHVDVPMPPADAIGWVTIAAPTTPVALGRPAAPGDTHGLAPEAGVTFAGPAFRIQRHEVTWAVYEAWGRANPARAVAPPAWVPASAAERADRPVVNVPWEHARAYCVALGGDLPTEEQWEYAARGAARRPNPWGASPARAGLVAFRGESPAVGRVATDPVDRTPEGVHDLGGNAQEWTASPYRADDGSTPPWAGGYHPIRGLPLREARPREVPSAGVYRNPGCATADCNAQDRRALETVGFRCVRPAAP